MATETQQMAPHDASGAAIEWKSTDRVGTRSRLIDAATLAVVSVGLFVLILAPRLNQLDAFVTPDEATWIGRSANFYQALSSGHYKDTYQFVHPGVPVMWLGTLGFRLHIPDMADLMGRQLGTRGPATKNVLENAGYQIVDVLVELRQMMAIASALILVGTFFCLAKIVRVWVAAAAIAFVSLDPMNIGFSRLLHLDGLSANLILLSIVAFCWHLERRSRVAVVVSGIAAGLACLTRFADVGLALLVLLFAALDLFLDWRADRSILGARLRSNVTSLVIWGLVAIIVFVALWPAMWVAPIETLRTMWQGSTELADHTQEINILFRGQSVHGDPGWTYYPVVLAYRLSPLTVFGLLLAVIGTFRPHDLGKELPRRLCANLAIQAAIYLGIISLAAKKADRYVLPSMVALDLVAALAWISIARPRPCFITRDRRVYSSDSSRSRPEFEPDLHQRSKSFAWRHRWRGTGLLV
jgi:hypothetical protein